MPSLYFRESGPLVAVGENVFAETVHDTSRPLEFRRRPRRIWATLDAWQLRMETASDDQIGDRRRQRAKRDGGDPDEAPATLVERLSQRLTCDVDDPRRELATIAVEGTRSIASPIRLELEGADREVGHLRHWPKSDYGDELLSCAVYIRRERMDWLVGELARWPDARIVVGIEVPLFEYEVDDALGEPTDHKVFHLEPDAQVELTSFSIAVVAGPGAMPVSEAASQDDVEPDDLDQQPSTPIEFAPPPPPRPQPQPQPSSAVDLAAVVQRLNWTLLLLAVLLVVLLVK